MKTLNVRHHAFAGFGGLQKHSTSTRQSARHLRHSRQQCNTTASQGTSAQVAAEALKTLPNMPPQIGELKEQAALDMAASMQVVPLIVPSMASPPVQTAFVGPSLTGSSAAVAGSSAAPIVLVASFDSSLLEWRRLYPLLAQHRETWALDVVPWGFTTYPPPPPGAQHVIGPLQRRDHLFQFWQDKVGRPMVLVGSSLGGATAIDFALAHPEAVEKLVLIDPQAFADGIGQMSALPRFVSSLGVQVLRSKWLRMMANKMAYYDVDTFATEEAMLTGRLHTWLPGWQDGMIAFMESGGYALSKQICEVQQPALVLWGDHDTILSPEQAERFRQELPQAELVWLEDCGHCGQLEQPAQVAEQLLRFIS